MYPGIVKMGRDSNSSCYQAVPPPVPLDRFIESVWIQKSPWTPDAEPTVVLPTGRQELIFNLGDPFVVLNGHTNKQLPDFHITGHRDKPIAVSATGKTHLIIVRLKPWASLALLPGAGLDLYSGIGDLTEVMGREPHEQLSEAFDKAHDDELGNNFFNIIGQMGQSWSADSSVQATIELMHRSWGRMGVGEIAKAVGLSRRQLSRRFTQHTGTTPKRLLKIIQVQKAVHLLREGHPVQDVVANCGYYDQAHLCHSVRCHTRKTPNELTQYRTRDLGEFYNRKTVNDYCSQVYL